MYPILVYRDIIYFQLTWKFAVETFGWEYNWSSEKGFEISAMNGMVHLIKMVFNI